MANKSFSMTKGPKLAAPGWVWHKTVMDVRLGNSVTYCADVRAWADAVHKDIQQEYKEAA